MSAPRVGPLVTVSRSCFGCVHCEAKPYHCQSDSGHDVTCSLAYRKIGDTTWNTPSWCPVAPEGPTHPEPAVGLDDSPKPTQEEVLDHLLTRWGDLLRGLARGPGGPP